MKNDCFICHAPISCYQENWSGRRDSNSRPQPWQGCALPLSYARIVNLMHNDLIIHKI
jgi:hypothetical protein